MGPFDIGQQTVNRCIQAAAEQLLSMDLSRPGEIATHSRLKSQTSRLLHLIRSVMYPQIFDPSLGNQGLSADAVRDYLQQVAVLLRDMLDSLLDKKEQVEGTVCGFIGHLPEIVRILETDIQAAYTGDPAAKSREEIMLAYPAFEAISIFRLAHRLYELNIPLIPRIMTEFAHQSTGIDIHPGATIGDYFFIDHGTGVVIGETCTIGEHVKLYQGVTLGAKSFELDENGNPIKGIKRHPDIGNHVVIYSGATILGGNTVIGDHCIIGGNVWLTHSVEPGNTVYNCQGAQKKASGCGADDCLYGGGI